MERGYHLSSMQIHQFPFPIIPHVNCLLLCVRTLETIPPQKLFFIDIPNTPNSSTRAETNTTSLNYSFKMDQQYI